jgi:MFS family permease
VPTDDELSSNRTSVDDVVAQHAVRPVDELSDDAGPTGTFASLQVRAYRTLFWSGMISFASVQGQTVARGWLAKELTSSNAALGGVFLAFGLTMLVTNPIGGVVADRFSRKAVLAWTQIAMIASSVWIGLAVSFDFLTYWQLLLASGVQAMVFAFLGPARMAMTSELVGPDLLPNAVVLGQLSANSTRVIGPSLAGIAIGISWIGSDGVYYVAAVLSAVALWQVLQLPDSNSLRVHAGQSPLEEFSAGIRYARRHREVRLLLITSFVVVMMAFPYNAFLPKVADGLFNEGSKGYGYLSGASAVGAVAVSLVIARMARNDLAWKMQSVSGLAFGLGLFLLAAAPTFILALAAAVVLGGAASGFTAMNNTLTLTLSDLEYHGRLQSLMMLSFSGFGIAALPLGAVADGIGLRSTFTGMGVVTIVAMLVSITLRARWTDDRPSMT